MYCGRTLPKKSWQKAIEQYNQRDRRYGGVKGGSGRCLRQGLLSGIVLVIVLIATVGYGGNILFLLLLAVSLIGMTELYKVVGAEQTLLGVVGYLAAAFYYRLLYVGELEHVMTLSILFLVLLMAVYVFYVPEVPGRTGDDRRFSACSMWP